MLNLNALKSVCHNEAPFAVTSPSKRPPQVISYRRKMFVAFAAEGMPCFTRIETAAAANQTNTEKLSRLRDQAPSFQLRPESREKTKTQKIYTCFNNQYNNIRPCSTGTFEETLKSTLPVEVNLDSHRSNNLSTLVSNITKSNNLASNTNNPAKPSRGTHNKNYHSQNSSNSSTRNPSLPFQHKTHSFAREELLLSRVQHLKQLQQHQAYKLSNNYCQQQQQPKQSSNTEKSSFLKELTSIQSTNLVSTCSPSEPTNNEYQGRSPTKKTANITDSISSMLCTTTTSTSSNLLVLRPSSSAKRQKPFIVSTSTSSKYDSAQDSSLQKNNILKTMTSQRYNYSRPFVPPAKMTAYAYLAIELPSNTVHISWNSHTSLQIASLTKIMTCYVVLRLMQAPSSPLEDNNIYNALKNQSVLIGNVETNITGTSAELEKGFYYTVEQLLYGLMLPSGNDASLALAVWGGKHLHIQRRKSNPTMWPEDKPLKKREAIALFLQRMNETAAELGMKKTKYCNPHGLSNPENKSTAQDISILCRKAMEVPEFRTIVSTKIYSTTIQNQDRSIIKQISWANTHKLLRKPEYKGIKTGMTTTAGACLASYLEICKRTFIIVVLKCKKQERRFKETDILKKWVMKKEGMVVKKSGKRAKNSTSEEGETRNNTTQGLNEEEELNDLSQDLVSSESEPEQDEDPLIISPVLNKVSPSKPRSTSDKHLQQSTELGSSSRRMVSRQ